MMIKKYFEIALNTIGQAIQVTLCAISALFGRMRKALSLKITGFVDSVLGKLK
jgi:hypothetical protein